MFASMPATIEHIRAGKLRALGVTIPTRSDVFPDVPSISEFLPGFDASVYYGIGAPKNTPAEIVERLNKEINAGLADPQLKARLHRARQHAVAGIARRFRQVHCRTKLKSGRRW